MKLLFASDIHGCLPAAKKMIEHFNQSQADQLVLLGDVLYHGPRNNIPQGYDPQGVVALLNPYKNKIMCVRGNCEAEVDQMLLEFPCLADYHMIFADHHRFFITHGHLFNKDHLPPLCENDIFVHGHFHVPMLEKKDGIVIVNPNSISLPKQGVASFAIYEDHQITLYDLNTAEVISTLKLDE